MADLTAVTVYSSGKAAPWQASGAVVGVPDGDGDGRCRPAREHGPDWRLIDRQGGGRTAAAGIAHLDPERGDGDLERVRVGDAQRAATPRRPG